MKKIKILLLFCASAMLVATSCKKDDGIFSRENDTVSCDCTEQSIAQNILCDGEWVADFSGSEWITISPERGVGNGVDYGTFNINVKYNSGAERTDVVYLVYKGQSYPITVTQGPCNFAYGATEVNGTLFMNFESNASVMLPYSGASGEESVQISGTVSGDAAAGLNIATGTYSSFVKGSGALTIPIAGTPTKHGKVTFEVFVDGVSAGTTSANVVQDPDAMPKGLPAGWNLYAAGYADKAGAVASPYNASWTTGGANSLDHKVLPSLGSNTGAYMTVKTAVSNDADYTFNPGIQIKGMQENDYFLFVIPVENISAESVLSVEASTGGAGSAAGFYAVEYSDNNTTWRLADGSTSMTVFGATADVHYSVPASNTVNPGRTTYDKETDEGYRKYTFPLTGIETIYKGNLYVRLRVCMNRRINGSETTNTIAASAWGDLKGFEVALVED